MDVERDKKLDITSKKILCSIKQYSKILLNWRSGITYLLCFLGLLVYELIPMRFLQLFFSEISAKIHRLCGHDALASDTYLYIDGFWSRISKECTYMQLFFATIPLVLRKETIFRNVVRLCIYFILILSVNLVRLIITDNLVLVGVSWKIAHGLVNHLTYGPIVILVFFLWIKAGLKREQSTISE
jgi:hypothetical protein